MVTAAWIVVLAVLMLAAAITILDLDVAAPVGAAIACILGIFGISVAIAVGVGSGKASGVVETTNTAVLIAAGLLLAAAGAYALRRLIVSRRAKSKA